MRMPQTILTRDRLVAGRAILAVGVALLLAGVAAAAEPNVPVVRLPSGVTPLADIGLYRVGCRLPGKPPITMPLSWSGGFTKDTGLAFLNVAHGGRPALLLHSPWRIGPGEAFVEYRLELPEAKPAALKLAIAVSAEGVRRGDGVTFAIDLTAGGKTTRLLDQHYAKSEPKELSFDLAAHAGRRVLLRLATSPGPKGNADFDFSHFVEPRIIAGDVGDPVKHIVDEMTATKAYGALAEADLLKLANRPGGGVVPSCKLEHRNLVRKLKDAYQFIYEGADCRIVYEYRPTTGTLDDITVRVDDAEPFRCCREGGAFFDDNGRSVPPALAKLAGSSLDGNEVRAEWQLGRGGQTAVLQWTFRIRGKSLVIGASSAAGPIREVSLGRQDLAPIRKAIRVPYFTDNRVCYLPRQEVFASAMLDWTRSKASRSPGTRSVYLKKLDGKRNDLKEVGYVAVSHDLDEVLPNLRWKPSMHRKLLAPKLVVDIWDGDWKEDARTLEAYKASGLDEIAVIKHVWQRYGYDQKLPDTLPPAGSDRDKRLREYVQAAVKLGYLFALHENYIEVYPDAPSYDANDLALDPNGRPWKAWYHTGTKTQSYALKPSIMREYAARFSPEIHRRYGTNASFIDVHAAVEPWRYCDFSPDSYRPGQHFARSAWTRVLFCFMQHWHRGPCLSEGGRHWYWAGVTDGVEAQLDGGEDRPVLVDFNLLKLHPQMVSHGMGYYTRWLRTGKATRVGSEALTPLQLDKYRAQTLAYGHAPFIGREIYRSVPLVVREYHIARPVAAMYGAANVTDIAYEVAGKMVSSSVAAVAGVLDRLRVRYDSGLTLHVNLREDDWNVGGHVLPRYGFVANGPNTLVYTARRGGAIVDFADTPGSLYVDARAQVHLPWQTMSRDIEPRLRSVKYVGGDEFEITYEWVVKEKLPRDVRCFVHFHDATVGTKDPNGTHFQDDHALPTPATQWIPGTVVVDGPHRVRIPQKAAAGRYDVLIGLHPDKWSWLGLRGIAASPKRYVVGRLAVTRRGGRIVDIRSVDIDDWRRRQARRARPFAQRMNTDGRKIDFGPVATNGSFTLLKAQGGIELLPYPRYRKFTVEIDLSKLRPGWRLRTPRVIALGADRKRLGSVRHGLANGRLAFDAGMAGAVRFLIEDAAP